MGCGKSKHALATTESVKKSSSRSSSRKIEDPTTTTTTTTVTTTIDRTNETKKDLMEIVDGNKNGEEAIGVIPGKPFTYEKPGNGAKKKLVVVVGHDRTASKESQVSDYFTDGFEDKSEYESPVPNQEKAVNEAVVVVQELAQSAKLREIEDGMKQAHFRAEEGLSQRQGDQAIQAETTMAAKDIEEQESRNNAAKQENKIIEIAEVKPNKLVVRTKIQENEA